jgi:hypothetical protein
MRIGGRNVFLIATVLMAGIACEQTVQSDEPPLSEVLAPKIAFGLRWIAYWKPNEIIKYKAGETIRVKLVQSPDELVVFLSRVRVSITFRRSADGKLDRLDFVNGLSRIGNETLDSDVRFYIQSHSTSDRPGFRLKPGADGSIARFGIPAERVTVANPLTPAWFRVSNAIFRLPNLAPPNYISRRIRPPAPMADSLRSAVTQAALSYMTPDSKPATVVIPYFSPEDPEIHVFVNFQATDSSDGIFWVKPAGDGGWLIPKLILNRGQEHLNSTITKIRAMKFIEFVVKPGALN